MWIAFLLKRESKFFFLTVCNSTGKQTKKIKYIQYRYFFYNIVPVFLLKNCFTANLFWFYLGTLFTAMYYIILMVALIITTKHISLIKTILLWLVTLAQAKAVFKAVGHKISGEIFPVLLKYHMSRYFPINFYVQQL